MTTAESWLAELVSTVGNAGLKLDPLSEARLAELEGRVVLLEVLGPTGGAPLTATLSVRRASLQISAGGAGPADAIVRGTPADLLGWLSGARGTGQLQIEGDEQLLSALTGLLEKFEPDLAEPLTRLIGAQAADSVLGAAEAAFALLRSATQAVSEATRDQARASFTDTSGLEQAVSSVEALELRLDRLAARLERVEARRSAPAASAP